MKNLTHCGSTNRIPKSELSPQFAVFVALARSRAKLSVRAVLNWRSRRGRRCGQRSAAACRTIGQTRPDARRRHRPGNHAML